MASKYSKLPFRFYILMEFKVLDSSIRHCAAPEIGFRCKTSHWNNIKRAISDLQWSEIWTIFFASPKCWQLFSAKGCKPLFCGQDEDKPASPLWKISPPSPSSSFPLLFQHRPPSSASLSQELPAIGSFSGKTFASDIPTTLRVSLHWSCWFESLFVIMLIWKFLSNHDNGYSQYGRPAYLDCSLTGRGNRTVNIYQSQT